MKRWLMLHKIQDYQFARLRRDDPTEYRDKDLGQWFINVCYDETLGLLLDEPNPNLL